MKKFILGIGLLFLVGCSSTPPIPELSPMQLKQISTQETRGSYQQAVRATVTVLQDEGYIIQNIDYNMGSIFAGKDIEKHIDEKIDAANRVSSPAGMSYQGIRIELGVSIEKINSTQSEIGLTAKKMLMSYSKYANSIGSAKTIQDSEFYKALFDKIKVELERIKAQK